MRKLTLSIFFVILCVSSALAESLGDYHKVEFYGGYTIAKTRFITKSAAFECSTPASCASNETNVSDLFFLKLLLQMTGL